MYCTSRIFRSMYPKRYILIRAHRNGLATLLGNASLVFVSLRNLASTDKSTRFPPSPASRCNVCQSDPSRPIHSRILTAVPVPRMRFSYPLLSSFLSNEPHRAAFSRAYFSGQSRQRRLHLHLDRTGYICHTYNPTFHDEASTYSLRLSRPLDSVRLE